MSNRKQLDLLEKALAKNDISPWNDWRRANPGVRLDLSRADFPGANLIRANLSAADLSFANFAGALLTHARLAGAVLSGADLTEAELTQADLDSACLPAANLTRTDLTEALVRAADLSQANFTRTTLSYTNLTNAIVRHTIFADVDLSTAKGLETVKHRGPSEISISTIYKSGGNIPEAFLRGAGVPDDMITIIQHQIGTARAIQFYSAFISYSTQDQDLAQRLHADLQAHHVRVWFAPEDLKIGDPIKQTIDEAVRLYDKLILVLSSNSIDRAWVRHEFGQAIEKEKRNNRLVLFPIRLDDSVFATTEQWAYDIRQRHIGDFRNWKNHDDYRKAFERLLRDLQAT